MDFLNQLVSDVNGVLWGVFFLIPLLCGTGIFYTIKLRFVQVRKFGLAARFLLGGASLFGKRADKSGMSSFQALATAVAAQVGTGNVAGTATALVAGGPGSLFWLWVAAFFGMATIFAEAVLAQTYRTKDEQGRVLGGPAYYITLGMGEKWRPLAVFFSIAIIIALGCIGNMVPSRTPCRPPSPCRPASRASCARCSRASSSSAASAVWRASPKRSFPSWRPSTSSAASG